MARVTALTSRDFEQVFAHGKRSSDRFFTVLVHPNGLPHVRLGMVVSRKVDKRATRRNRIRRLIRERVRLDSPTLHGLDVVVLARRTTVESPGAALWDSLRRHWGRLIDAQRNK